MIEGLARQAYLDAYFKKMGDEQKITAEAARERYMDKHVKFTDKEIKETLDKYKNHREQHNGKRKFTHLATNHIADTGAAWFYRSQAHRQHEAARNQANQPSHEG